MKRVLLGVAAAAAMVFIAGAGANAARAPEAKGADAGPHEVLPGYLPNEKSFPGYLHNTLVLFVYGTMEEHSWYEGVVDEGGDMVWFEASKDAKGNISLRTQENKWKFYDGYRARVTLTGADGVEGIPFELQDAYPGDTWRMLNAQEPRRDMREVFTLLPGHQ